MWSAELGRPVAYTAIAEGTPVYEPDGTKAGVVEEIIADDAADIFDGVIVHTLPLPGRHLFADADQIAELHQRGVVLSVRREQLHDPETQRAPAEPGERVESRLQARLRRAWDWIREHVP